MDPFHFYTHLKCLPDLPELLHPFGIDSLPSEANGNVSTRSIQGTVPVFTEDDRWLGKDWPEKKDLQLVHCIEYLGKYHWTAMSSGYWMPFEGLRSGMRDPRGPQRDQLTLDTGCLCNSGQLGHKGRSKVFTFALIKQFRDLCFLICETGIIIKLSSRMILRI